MPLTLKLVFEELLGYTPEQAEASVPSDLNVTLLTPLLVSKLISEISGRLDGIYATLGSKVVSSSTSGLLPTRYICSLVIR